MAAMEPIDISSSDSDVEISGAVETYRSLNGACQSLVSSRSIAPDAAGPSRYFVDAGYMGNPRKLPSPRRAQASERSSSNGDHSSSVKHKHLTPYIDTPR
uniref:Uncharacterized protein n=1 Tax=Kalanchoe fedtschenkoi TaxID=63787 RepID=A0A7N0TWG3_KALFE